MSDQPVLNLSVQSVNNEPFPHVLSEEFIRGDLYEELQATFPTCGRNSGPTGYTCFNGDAEYDELMAGSSAWRALHAAVHDQAFVDYTLRQFRDVFANEAAIDLSNARYVPYVENRADKQRRHIEYVEHAPDELWIRLDIMQGHVGYSRVRHLDHRRRAISMLIYFSDADEHAMVGGDLVLHERGKPAKTIRPRRNRMAMFPCNNASYHSVSVIESQSAPRNFVQVTVSSSVDIWEPAPLPHVIADAAAGKLRSLARRLPVWPAARRA